MTDNRLPPMVPGPIYPELNPIDEAITEALEAGLNPLEVDLPDMDIEEMAEPESFDIVKRLSSNFGRSDKRRTRLVRRLKRRRSYAPPKRGGKRTKHFK